jgi:hypothetical protein
MALTWPETKRGFFFAQTYVCSQVLGQTDRICVAVKAQHILSCVEDPHAVTWPEI